MTARAVGVCMVFIFGGLALCLMAQPVVSAVGELRIVTIDVGQGDAILVRSPDGHDFLVDGGRPDRCPTGYLNWIGVARLAALVVSNPDSDHVGCLATVLRSMPVDLVIHNGQAGPSAAYAEFAEAVSALAIPTAIVRSGDVLTWGCCLTATVLHPAGLQGSINDNSVVLRVTYSNTHALLTGDATMAAEAELLARWDAVESQFLKVAHHGSPSSTSLDFLAAARPQIAAISVGAGNPYDHPSPDVLARLAHVGAVVYRTDVSGTLTFVSNGSALRLEQTGYRVALPIVLAPLLSATPTPTWAAQPTHTATPTQPPATGAVVRVASWCTQVDAPGNDNSNLNEEYVCFENQGAASANMIGWHVRDLSDHIYTFPAFTLAPGAHVLLRTGSGRNTTTDLYWGHTQAIWNNDHDTVFLFDQTWDLIDLYAY